MKKHFTLGILTLFLLNLLFIPSFSQEIADILDKMIEASGGRKALERIKDTTISGTVEMTQMGLSGTMTFYHKEPNKFRQDIEVMGMVITSAFDGELAWTVNPQTGSTEELPEQAAEMVKREALSFGNSVFLYPEKFGVVFSYKGKEKVETKDYLVLEQTFPDGHVTVLYVDPETYLIYKSKETSMNQMGSEVEQELFYSDYKEVNGTKYPHFIKILQDGEEFGSMTVTELNFNTGLEDSLFKMSE